MVRRNRAQAGFTLLELMIAITLLLIVMLMIAEMFSSAQNIYRLSAERAEVYSQGRVFLDVLDADLQRIDTRGSDLTLLGKAPKNVLQAEAYQKLYHDFKFLPLPENKTTLQIEPLLSFDTTTSWFDRNTNRYESGLAQVVYYLRKRPERELITGQRMPATGAYLMRRVIPRRYYPRKPDDPALELPPEEEVASSVLDVRLYAYNNASPAYMAQRRKAVPLFAELDELPDSYADILRDPQLNAPQNNNPNAPQNQNFGNVLLYASPTPGKTYSFGPVAGSIAENIASRASLPLAIGVEITFVNEDFEIDEDQQFYGTVRTLRRIIALPNAQVTQSLSDKDLKRFE